MIETLFDFSNTGNFSQEQPPRFGNGRRRREQLPIFSEQITESLLTPYVNFLTFEIDIAAGLIIGIFLLFHHTYYDYILGLQHLYSLLKEPFLATIIIKGKLFRYSELDVIFFPL